MNERILIACPTHACKEYAFSRWIEAVNALTYKTQDILVVDNSPTLDLYQRWHNLVPLIHVDADQRPEQYLNRICHSMAVIQQHFLAGPWTRWFNLESDVIPPPNAIETLLYFGRDADWISHCYPVRLGDHALEQGIGCSLLSRKLIQDFDFSKADDSPDAQLWQFVRANPFTYKTVELWDVMRVEHLRN